MRHPVESITVTVPIPGKYCDPNVRTQSFQARASHIAKARKTGCLVMTDAINRLKENRRFLSLPWSSVEANIKWFHKTVRFRDVQNIIATLKATFDGFQDAGIVVDDNVISTFTVERLKDADDPRVEITLTRCDAEMEAT